MSPPLRRRLDAMLLQDIGHAGIRNLVTHIGQGALNAVITPGGVFLGEANHQIANHLRERRTTGFLLPTVAVVPLSSYQEPMPAQDGVRREKSADLVEELATKDFPFDGQRWLGLGSKAARAGVDGEKKESCSSFLRFLRRISPMLFLGNSLMLDREAPGSY